MSFTFNNINCETLGMFVEEYPDRPFPQRKVTAYSVAGRNGDLLVDEGAYTNVIQEYKVFVKGSGGNTLQQNLSVIGAWLLGTAGYHELRDDYDTSIYRLARCVNAVEFLNSLNRYGKATIQFDCQPQRFPITPEVLTSTGGTAITYPTNGYFPAYPYIEVTGIRSNDDYIIYIGRVGSKASPSIYMLGFAADVSKLIIDTSSQAIYDEATGTRPVTNYMFDINGEWKPIGDGALIEIHTANTSIVTKITTRRFFGI